MLGTVLGGHYKIITILGAGGFGQTYLADDTHQPRRCVVKQLKPLSRDARMLEIARRLFDTEVEALRRLGQHDQIPELYDSFQENDEFYFVQEYVDGHPLSEEFSRGQRLSEAEVVALLQDVLSVLQFVHQNQAIHRDIKPGNLIRRRHDGKIVLIDFGAVKELQTQLSGTTGHTSFTVGIGTQGYTPSEQLMGRPRFCSDIYALGMTAIQAVTGMPPSQLPEDPNTLDLRWQDRADIGLGLAFVLDRMVRYDFSQRYQSVEDVLQALQRLADLPTDVTEIPASLLLPQSLMQDWTQPMAPLDWRSHLQSGVKVLAIATVAVTGLVLGLRQVGWLEPLELAAYDQMTRLQPAQLPDPRLLIVGINEADLQTLQRPTPSDQSVAEALKQLQQFQPRVIGLDLYRDLPQEPGYAELLRQLQAENVVAIMKLGDNTSAQIPPPPGVPAERVGFNDLAIDTDNLIRRNLVFANTVYSFSMRLTQKYLEADGIKPRNSPTDPEMTQLGNTLLRPLEPTSGGYQNADAGGYQVMLRYRSPTAPARIISFTDVLNGEVNPEWVRDRVVLIGTTAPSSKDLFLTPYSASERTQPRAAGVVVHAQATSQLLSAVLDGQRLIWVVPDWAEALWIASWGVVGGTLGWIVRHPGRLAASSAVALGLTVGTGLVLFSQGGWIPIAAPAIALLLADVSVTTYRTYRESQRQGDRTQLFWDETVQIDLTRKTR